MLSPPSEVADRVRPGLRTFRDERGRELFDLPDAPRPAPGTPAPVRLVAEFDNLVLSHADRARVISPGHRQRLNTRNGIFPGTVLIDGFVGGVWRLTRSRRTAVLTVELFGSAPPRDRDAVGEQPQRLVTATRSGSRPSPDPARDTPVRAPAGAGR